MKKTWYCVCILVVLLLPLMNNSISAQPEIRITPLGGFFPGAVIQNVGDEDAEFIYWDIQIQGGLLQRINVSGKGWIESLPADDHIATSIRLASFIFGYGPITITITINGENVETMTLMTTGLLLFVYILLLRPLPLI